MNLAIARNLSFRSFKAALLGLALAGACSSAWAQTVVDGAWVRATVPGQPSTGAFLTLTASTASTLLGAQSPVAGTVQIHQSSMKDDVMRMLPVEQVPLPAGTPVVFDTQGYHIMLIDLKQQVKEGDQVPLTLTLVDDQGTRQTLDVTATARALNQPDHAGHDAHHGH